MWSTGRCEDRLRVGDVDYPLRVRRHARARSFRLSVDPVRGEIRLGLPERANLKKAVQWAATQQDWLAAQLARAPGGITLADGATFPFEGRDVRIEWRPHAPRRIVLDGDVLALGGPRDALSPRILRWLRETARATLDRETHMFAARAGLKAGQVSVGDPRSRWGSCASSGNIRYNWRLICAPLFVRHATVAHEVAHLAHMDHSAAFHARHAEIFGGDPAPARRWLREHGAMLHRIGV